MLNKKITGSPVATVLWLLIVIGIVELLIMLIPGIHMLSRVSHAIVSSLILTIVISPVLYLYISKRKRVEDELRESKAFAENLIASMKDGFSILDSNGVHINVNPALCKMTGFSREELIGVGAPHPYWPPDAYGDMGRVFRKTLRGKFEDLELTFMRKSGERFPVILSPSCIRDKHGNVISYLATIKDITERKQTEEKLRATNKELRTMHKELVRSERLAAIGQLAGGVGHELRNPLGAIKNAVYYIRRKVAMSELAQKEPRVVEFLDIMDDEVNSSSKIISDLLGFSQVGKPSVSPTQVEEVIEDALSHLTIPENIELTKKLNANLPKVEIDANQIQQVLVNIIMNAVQAMPQGGKLTIGAKRREKLLEVEIADTGCGIPQEAVDKIFDPLFTTKAKGIGLGLAVCKAIIDRHQGDIEVESQVGKGTTFSIRLPLKA